MAKIFRREKLIRFLFPFCRRKRTKKEKKKSRRKREDKKKFKEKVVGNLSIVTCSKAVVEEVVMEVREGGGVRRVLGTVLRWLP